MNMEIRKMHNEHIMQPTSMMAYEDMNEKLGERQA